jgi:hypothetical protein
VRSSNGQWATQNHGAGHEFDMSALTVHLRKNVWQGRDYTLEKKMFKTKVVLCLLF